MTWLWVLGGSLLVAVVVFLAVVNRGTTGLTLTGGATDTAAGVVAALAAFIGALIGLSAFFGWKPFPSDSDCKDYSAFVRDTYVALKYDKDATKAFVNAADLGELRDRCNSAALLDSLPAGP